MRECRSPRPSMPLGMSRFLPREFAADPPCLSFVGSSTAAIETFPVHEKPEGRPPVASEIYPRLIHSQGAAQPHRVGAVRGHSGVRRTEPPGWLVPVGARPLAMNGAEDLERFLPGRR